MKSVKENRPKQSRVIQNRSGDIVKHNKQDILLRQFIQCMRMDIQLGNPFEYIIDRAELWNGTKTTQNTRNFVNNQAIVPNNITLDYAIYNTFNDALFGINHIFATNNNVPNPQLPGVRWDAGHALARENGGLGNNVNHVFPQNRIINRGWGGTYHLWRAHEDNFNQQVAQHGYGRWRVR